MHCSPKAWLPMVKINLNGNNVTTDSFDSLSDAPRPTTFITYDDAVAANALGFKGMWRPTPDWSIL
jgi:hypothetical protein